VQLFLSKILEERNIEVAELQPVLHFPNLSGGSEWPVPFPIPDFKSTEKNPRTATLMKKCKETPDPEIRKSLMSSYSVMKRNILHELSLAILSTCKKVYPNCNNNVITSQ